ncbi:Hsp70 family protein [soil metagenome]
MNKSFSIGIDLGTSNSALATVQDFDPGGEAVPTIVPTTQIVAPNQAAEMDTLSSALYLPHPEEFPTKAVCLPWQSDSSGPLAVAGHFARDHGALVPDRLVTSAKSWLSNPQADPKGANLPWNSQIPSDAKVSAFEASRRYLEHLARSFASAHPERSLADAEIVVTVPASFDEPARTLTAEAAEAAGLGKVVLLEEPQAAFYAWTAQVGKAWRSQVAAGDIVLVCDIGGGTADFSLLAITEADGNLEVERISVGEHLLLGGDNMDLAIAYTLRAQLEAGGHAIDDWQFLALVHASAKAKIALLGDDSLAEAPIAVPSRGSSLLAKTLSTKLSRATLDAIALDGFLPLTAIGELPAQGAASGLKEMGLPYAADPVMSKHLARFLTRSLANVRASESLATLVGETGDAPYLRPSAVLFNGGVFNAAPLRKRILDLLASWDSAGEPVRELAGFQPDLAVARGAALYGRNRATGQGIRIRSGTARSYYIGLESSMPAVPGFKPPVKALCIVPQGMEEGSELVIEGQEFGLLTGQPATFRFFSSEVRSGDTPGQILPNAELELEETAMIEVTLPPAEGIPDGHALPVQINPLVTELGNLELWMKHSTSDQRWKVEFQIRME